ncbi:uncharacterized protein LOC127850072 isoform X1 [Dreissena polymorpha]|nr:uncharacterized protein LOC127850072 isoform X1 [Dreissena polymorpha]
MLVIQMDDPVVKMPAKPGNNYPYLLVQEGIKKNQSSERLRKFLSTKVMRRAQIELTYIRELQDWLNDLRPLTEGTSNGYLDNEVTRRIIGSLKTDTQAVIEARQRAYNMLMSESGPYVKLQSCETQMSQIDLQFVEIFKKRQEVEDEFKKQQDMFEHTNNQIEALETKLAHRSHVITARRPASRAGPRKVDEMRESLSKLRHQNETVSEKAEMLREKLAEIDSANSQTMAEMDSRLQELEADRIRAMVEHVKTYLTHVAETLYQGVPRDLKVEGHRSLDSVEGLLKVHWVDVRANAKRVERGDSVKYTEMFGVDPMRSDRKLDNKTDVRLRNGRSRGSKDGAVSLGGITKGLSSELRSDPERRQHKVLTSSHSMELHNTGSILSHLTQTSGSDSSLEDFVPVQIMNGSRSNFVTKFNPGSNTARTTKSKDSIESLELPPEERCVANISSVDPNRQYRTRATLAKSDEHPTTAQITEYSSMTRFDADDSSSETDSGGNDVTNAKNLTNVRMIAKQDNYPAPGTEELAFKAGQIIKQKRGVDTNGMCYGWTREGRMGRKIYGYYKPAVVRLMNPSRLSK